VSNIAYIQFVSIVSVVLLGRFSEFRSRRQLLNMLFKLKRRGCRSLSHWSCCIGQCFLINGGRSLLEGPLWEDKSVHSAIW